MSSATLTWYAAGLGVKTATTIGAYIDDFETLVGTKSADANFKWEVAGKNSGATSPQYLLLRRKDGSAGRIALINWSSSPAANNAAILQTTPANANVYGVWFPNGTGTTLSNLTSASGTICGSDTACTRAGCIGPVSSLYGASVQPFYLDTAECMGLFTQNPGVAGLYGAFIGDCTVDGSDNAVGAVISTGGTTWQNFGTNSSPIWVWSANSFSAGATGPVILTNHSTLSAYAFYVAYYPTGGWASTASATALFNTTTNQVEIPPVLLRPGSNNASALPSPAGFPLKMRQIGYGPPTTSALSVLNITGPVVNARQVNAATAGGNSYPWVVNQKN